MLTFDSLSTEDNLDGPAIYQVKVTNRCGGVSVVVKGANGMLFALDGTTEFTYTEAVQIAIFCCEKLPFALSTVVRLDDEVMYQFTEYDF